MQAPCCSSRDTEFHAGPHIWAGWGPCRGRRAANGKALVQRPLSPEAKSPKGVQWDPPERRPPLVPLDGCQPRPRTVTGREFRASAVQPPEAPSPLTERLGGVPGPWGVLAGGQPAHSRSPGSPALSASPWEQLGSPTLGGVPHLFLWYLSPWHLLALKNTG